MKSFVFVRGGRHQQQHRVPFGPESKPISKLYPSFDTYPYSVCAAVLRRFLSGFLFFLQQKMLLENGL